MSEHLSLVFSIFSIIICLNFLIRQRRNGRPARAGGVRGGQQPRRNNRGGITATGPVVYFASEDHGLPSREYCFDYRKVNGNWRVYILKMPSLNRRNGAGSITHRHVDGNMHYICWDRPITSLENAQTISRAWADNIQRYIATGQRF